MNFTAYRFVCFVLCISIFLSLSLLSYAETVDVPLGSISVDASTHSFVSGIYQYAYDLEPNQIYSVTKDAPSALGYGTLSFDVDPSSLALGSTYLLSFVMAVPQGTIPFLDGSNVGSIITMNRVIDIVLGSNCTITNNFDRTEYPDLFSSSDLNYGSEAYLVTLSIDTEIADEFLNVFFQFDIASKNWYSFSIGYSYLTLSTSETDFLNSILINIQTLLYNISNDLNNSFSQLLNLVTSFKSSVLTSLSSIQSDMNAGFAELGDKLDNINQSISEGFQNNLDKAEDDLNNSSNNVNSENDSIKNEQSSVDSEIDDLLGNIQNEQAAQDQFLSDFNLGNVTEVTGFIYSAFNEYLSGIKWVGSFFTEVLTFTPFAYLMYIIVFINLLFLLLNNATPALGRIVRQDRNHELSVQRAEQRGVDRERKRSFSSEKRENQRAMFKHYGF